jgi:3-hydroxybutyryl-CoA dehydratase
MKNPLQDLARVQTFDDIAVSQEHSLEHTVTESEVHTFGHLSGDLNPLHMEQAFAERSAFKRRVVHGMFTAALVSAAHTELTGPGFVYVGQELKFKGPVHINDTVRLTVRVIDKKSAKRILVMETIVKNQSDEIVLTGTSALKELQFQALQSHEGVTA